MPNIQIWPCLPTWVAFSAERNENDVTEQKDKEAIKRLPDTGSKTCNNPPNESREKEK